MDKDALGEVKEAEIYYDFESPAWLKFLSQKEYTPGAGLAFGLGKLSSFQLCVLASDIAQ